MYFIAVIAVQQYLKNLQVFRFLLLLVVSILFYNLPKPNPTSNQKYAPHPTPKQKTSST